MPTPANTLFSERYALDFSDEASPPEEEVAAVAAAAGAAAEPYCVEIPLPTDSVRRLSDLSLEVEGEHTASPVLVLSCAGAPGERRFPLPEGRPKRRLRTRRPRGVGAAWCSHAGAQGNGIRAKLAKGEGLLRVTVPMPVLAREGRAAASAPAAASSGQEAAAEAEAADTAELRPQGCHGDGSDGGGALPPPLRRLDFGPDCDACAVVGPEAGRRKVIATRDIKAGAMVAFEAPLAIVKAGEPASSVLQGLGRAESTEWALTLSLLSSGALPARPRDWAACYAQTWAAEGAGGEGPGGGGEPGGGGADDAVVAAAVAAEVGGGCEAADAAAVHRVVCANAFALDTLALRLNYGAALFAACAFLNHSCDPNCLSARMGGNMAVFAARDIAAGEELTHSYVPHHLLLLPRAARRPHLPFGCACARCAAGAEAAGGPAAGSLDAGPASPAAAVLGRAAADVKAAAVAGTEADVTAAGAALLASPGARAALRQDPRAALDAFDTVVAAHWRGALGAVPAAPPNPGAVAAADAAREVARVWRDAAAALHRAADAEAASAAATGAKSDGAGVAAAAGLVHAAAEVALHALEGGAAQRGAGVGADADDAAAAAWAGACGALAWLTRVHGGSLACLAEDAACLQSMPPSFAVPAPEALLREAAVAAANGGDLGWPVLGGCDGAPEVSDTPPPASRGSTAAGGGSKLARGFLGKPGGAAARSAVAAGAGTRRSAAAAGKGERCGGETAIGGMAAAATAQPGLAQASNAAEAVGGSGHGSGEAGEAEEVEQGQEAKEGQDATLEKDTGPAGPAALLALLGCTPDDAAIRRFVAALREKSSGGPLAAAAVSRKFPPACEYVSYKALGLSLCFEAGRLDTLHLYNSGNTDGFAPYPGTLPHDVDLTAETGRSLVSRLGEPTSKGGAGRQLWLTYDHLGLKVDLAGVSWDGGGDLAVAGVALWDACPE